MSEIPATVAPGHAPITVGVIGVGKFGHNHARKLATNPRSRLVGIYDLDIERTREIGVALGIETYQDLDALLRDSDALCITTSTVSHAAIIKACLLAGKHVFVEKPITVTYQETRELAELITPREHLLACGHIERFQPEIDYIRQMDLGPPIYIEAERLHPFSGRSLDIDVVLDLMVHDLDLALWLIEDGEVEIDAVGTQVFTSSLDMAHAWMKFSSGSVANLAASRVSLKPSRKWRLFWKDRYASLDLIDHQLVMVHRSSHTNQLVSESIIFDKQDALAKELDAFLIEVAIKEGVLDSSIVPARHILCGFDEACVALKLAEGVKNAAIHSSS